MPLPSRAEHEVVARRAPRRLLGTSTSGMPYLAKKPFSLATNSGAASVSAMKPSARLGHLRARRLGHVSASPGNADRAAPSAPGRCCCCRLLRNRRRERRPLGFTLSDTSSSGMQMLPEFGHGADRSGTQGHRGRFGSFSVALPQRTIANSFAGSCTCAGFHGGPGNRRGALCGVRLGIVRCELHGIPGRKP